MNFFLKMRAAYTLIELLVVVAIMIVMAGILVSFSRLGQDQTTLYIESSKVIDIILRSRSLAISAYRDTTTSPPRATCAYGISLNTATGEFSLNRYLKKTDASARKCAEIGEVGSKVGSAGNYDVVVAESSTYQLARGIVFSAHPAETTISDILFRPPDPQIFFFRGGDFVSGVTSGNIVIKNTDGSAKISISIGQGGQITYHFID